jgi:enoyl-CoA hydratase
MTWPIATRELMEMYGYSGVGESPVFQDIIYEEAAPIARVIINRPNKRNAIRRIETELEIAQALQLATANNAIKVIILKGNGPCFSAGHDISPEARAVREAAGNRYPWQHMEKNLFETSLMRAPWDCPKPVIAQVHSYCLGAATSMVLMCDIAICSDDAEFGHPAQRGNGPHENAGLWVWALGPQWAKRLLLTGDRVNAETALRIGWVTEMVPRDELESTVETLAARMAKSPMQALAMNKRFVNRTVDMAGMQNMYATAADLVVMRRNDIDPDPEMGTHMRDRIATMGLKAALQARDGGRGDLSDPDR